MSKALTAIAAEDEVEKLALTNPEDAVEVEPERQITAWDVYTNVRYIGLPLQYIAVGIIYGGQGNVLYPIYQLILQEAQNYQNAIGAGTALFWSFKIFYGFLSDSVPIFGYRRKYYMVLGYILSFIATAAQALYVGAHETNLICFYQDGSGEVGPAPVDGACLPSYDSVDTETNATVTNALYYSTKAIDLSFSGTLYFFLMLATNLFYMIGDVAADGLSVEWAKREPENKRGQIQAYNYVMRFTASLTMSFVTLAGLDSPYYGGEKDYGLSLSGYIWILAAVQAVCIPFFFLINEEKVDPKLLVPFKAKLLEVWVLLQNKGFGTLMWFNVLWNALASVSVVPWRGVANYWVGVSAANYAWSGIFTNILAAFAIWFNAKYLVTYSWRFLQSFGLIASAIMNLLALIIVYNVNRSPTFWVFTQVDYIVFYFIGFVCVVWAATEMAPPGLEGTAVALATTAGNAAQTLSTWISNRVSAAVAPTITGVRGSGPWLGDNEADARKGYTYDLLVVTGINILACSFLWLSPSQKAMARHRFQTWGSTPAFGVLGILLVSFAVLYGTTTTLYIITCPCKEFNGGKGCVEGTCTPL